MHPEPQSVNPKTIYDLFPFFGHIVVGLNILSSLTAIFCAFSGQSLSDLMGTMGTILAILCTIFLLGPDVIAIIAYNQTKAATGRDSDLSITSTLAYDIILTLSMVVLFMLNGQHWSIYLLLVVCYGWSINLCIPSNKRLCCIRGGMNGIRHFYDLCVMSKPRISYHCTAYHEETKTMNGPDGKPIRGSDGRVATYESKVVTADERKQFEYMDFRTTNQRSDFLLDPTTPLVEIHLTYSIKPADPQSANAETHFYREFQNSIKHRDKKFESDRTVSLDGMGKEKVMMISNPNFTGDISLWFVNFFFYIFAIFFPLTAAMQAYVDSLSGRTKNICLRKEWSTVQTFPQKSSIDDQL
ncbi:hypothetical protein PCE1_002371 [Barthelona sp. PCE]